MSRSGSITPEASRSAIPGANAGTGRKKPPRCEPRGLVWWAAIGAVWFECRSGRPKRDNRRDAEASCRCGIRPRFT
jgi:hypothetical protein